MNSSKSINIGYNQKGDKIEIPTPMLNRHGLIAGATGTGKTVTLQVLAEQLSLAGIPVFAADIKGDLSGLAVAGTNNEKISARIETLGLKDFNFQASPTAFWDIYGKQGVPLRTTISEVGPLVLSHILELNETQSDILHLLFKFADDDQLFLYDLEDLISITTWISEQREDFVKSYGNVATATISSILRKLHVLKEAGGEVFFGEPAFNLQDLFQLDFSGRGLIHLLDATDLLKQPRLYSAFLTWLLSELFEQLPEVGDKELPKLVFFFDEAHLLFSQGSKALLEKFELVVRLIRSKGVGIFFVTQNPLDIPESIRAQLGGRILHALRASTPKELKNLSLIADTFNINPELNVKETIPTLKVGEALVSTLDTNGIPTPVEKTLIIPPHSQIGPITQEVRTSRFHGSPYFAKYSAEINRESAFEILTKRRTEIAEAKEQEKPKKTSNRQSIFEAFSKSIARSIGSQVGRQIIRGVLGSISK